MSDLVKTRSEGPVGIIAFNRPKQLNALNAAVAQAVISAAEAFDSDPDIGCIVLTGSAKAFAAGADISEMVGMGAAEMSRRDYFAEWQRFVDVKTPKIAAVNGYALGGGCEVMMMCDFAIAGESAKFGQPEIKLGVIARDRRHPAHDPADRPRAGNGDASDRPHDGGAGGTASRADRPCGRG